MPRETMTAAIIQRLTLVVHRRALISGTPLLFLSIDIVPPTARGGDGARGILIWCMNEHRAAAGNFRRALHWAQVGPEHNHLTRMIDRAEGAETAG